MLYHNSFDSFYRCPAGAVPDNTIVELAIKTAPEISGTCGRCLLKLWTPGNTEKTYEMQKTSTGYKINIDFDQIGVYWYYFTFSMDGKELHYCCQDGYSGGEGKETPNWTGSFQITVYDRKLTTPEWFKNSIMYQIFPDRFNRRGILKCVRKKGNIHHNWYEKPDYIDTGSTNRDFFGGNFNGVKDKLLYLKELGVNVVYFNPVFESQSNHRYDTGDYMKVDGLLGTEEEFKELIDMARRLGIRIILDGVFSHTGSNSRYFNKDGEYDCIGAYQSSQSQYYSWYHFNNHPHNYECWWGIDTLPNVNENDPGFQEYIFKGENSVVGKWMGCGVKGWRLDVADELPDEFLEGFYSKVKELDKDAVVIGEVWEDASCKRSYGKLRQFVLGKQFDSIMNYPLRNLIIDFIARGHQEEGTPHRCINAEELTNRLLNMYNNYPRDIFHGLMNFLSTHDTHRIMTLFEGAEMDRKLGKKAQRDYVPTMEQFETGVKRLKMAWAFIVSMPGVPCIYYGDEIGMTGYRDPFNRCTYPWGNENLDLFRFFKKMNSIRNENSTLSLGEYKPILAKEDVYAHERRFGSNSIVFVMNRSDAEVAVQLETSHAHYYVDMESGEEFAVLQSGMLPLEIGPMTYRLLRRVEHEVK